MNTLQQRLNIIAELYFRMGGTQAVICPGSRNAPLVVAFVRHPRIHCIPVSDERSAGFIGLGMAQQSKKPVALICTSGTAVLNFYPAICEAFYQNIPLVVITADRPAELIDQWDGQAIRQEGVFKNHILQELTLDPDGEMEGPMLELLEAGIQQNLPVHINIRLREPFYPGPGERYTYREERIRIRPASLLPVHYSLNDIYDINALMDQIRESITPEKKVKLLVILGFGHCTSDAMNAVDKAQQQLNFPILADLLSNYHETNVIRNYDFILDQSQDSECLQPELLISIGGAVLSKNLKRFISKYKPLQHIHVQAYGHIGNPFQSLSAVLRTAPELFFEALAKIEIDATAYYDLWKEKEERISTLEPMLGLPFCELKVAARVLASIPAESNLQLANSMPVRYPMLLGIDPTIKINSNRGTSGIDGCSSTAVGAAFISGKLTTLLTGDIAFFYDVNAYWNRLHLPHLRIIILNNGGGGIFRLIEGPSSLPELEIYFENLHHRTALNIAKDFDFHYWKAADDQELEAALENFYEDSDRPKILEVFTNRYINQRAYKSFREQVLNITTAHN